jgi:hypothetical protein
MDGENTSRPAAGSLVRGVVADPPLIGFDGNDIQNFFATGRHNVKGWHGV